MTASHAGWGHKLLSVIFALFSINAIIQVVMRLFGQNTDPLALTLFQVGVGASALAAAWGSWKLRPWAPVAAVCYAVITATMLFLLPSLLGLEAEARAGIWSGAVAVLGSGVLAGWWLRRRLCRLGSQRSAVAVDS